MLTILILMVLIAFGYFFSISTEKRRYKRLHEKDKDISYLPKITLQSTKETKEIKEYKLINRSVIVPINYTQNILASIVQFLGLNIMVNQLAIEKGRNEAISKMKSDVPNASEIVNMKIETSMIKSSIEVLVYGTAIYR